MNSGPEAAQSSGFERLSAIEFDGLSAESKVGYLILEAYDRLKHLSRWDKTQLRQDLQDVEKRIESLEDDVTKRNFSFEFRTKFTNFLTTPPEKYAVQNPEDPSLEDVLEYISKLDDMTSETTEGSLSIETVKEIVASLDDSDITRLSRQTLENARWRATFDAIIYARRKMSDQKWTVNEDGSLSPPK